MIEGNPEEEHVKHYPPGTLKSSGNLVEVYRLLQSIVQDPEMGKQPKYE
jgi:hypothetical protein